MKDIIDGKLYDTDTATMVCSIPVPTRDDTDSEWSQLSLYKSPKDQYFIAGEGGRWAMQLGDGQTSHGSVLVLVSERDARVIFRTHGFAEHYAQYFGPPEEG